MTGARHDWSMSYPVGGAAAPSLGSILFRFKRARALIGVLLFPSDDGTVARWHSYSPESLGIPRVSASSCSHRVPGRGRAGIHVPSRGGTTLRRHHSYAKGERILPPLGFVLFQFRGAHPTTGTSILPSFRGTAERWHSFSPIDAPRWA